MTYGARRAVINKRKVFSKHKDSAHPRCVEANKRAAKEVRRAKFNYERKLSDNVKYDAKSFYAYVRSRSKSRAGIGVLAEMMGEELSLLRRWRRNLMSTLVQFSV